MDQSTLLPADETPAKRGAQVLVSKRFIILASTAIALVYIGYGVGVLLTGNLSASADFGESFGSISGLLNGVGLIAAVVAVLLQHNQLQETQKEVHATLEAQKKQAAEATRAADAHEQSVRATRLLANVQGLSSLMTYYNSMRGAEIARLNSLQDERREPRTTSQPNRRYEIDREISSIQKDLEAMNNAALGYEKDLAALLKASGQQQGRPRSNA